MSIPPSHITNSITNAINVVILFTYCVIIAKSKNRYLKTVPYVFYLSFVITFLGVIVHYFKDYRISMYLWCLIDVFLLCFVMLLVDIFIKNKWFKIFLFLLNIGFAISYLFNMDSFISLALMQLLTFIILIPIVDHNMARIAFASMVASNLIWIVMVKIKFIPGYHNDIYHLCLIVSSYLFFLAAQKESWSKRVG